MAVPVFQCTSGIQSSFIPGGPVPQLLVPAAGSYTAFLRTSMFTCSCELVTHSSEAKMAPMSCILQKLSGFLSVVSAGVRDSVTSGPQAPSSAVPDTQMGQVVSLSASREVKTNGLI